MERTRKTQVQLVTEAAATLSMLRMQAESAESILHATIRDALVLGESATAIAEAAGLSRQRVYQIRDGRR